MNISRIIAAPDHIQIRLEDNFPGLLRVDACVPLICGDPQAEFTPGRTVFSWEGISSDDTITLPRFADSFDMLICRFDVSSAGEIVPGVRYVTDFTEDFSQYRDPQPVIDRPIGTWCYVDEEDLDFLRFGYMMDEMDHAWLMTLHPTAEDIPHQWNGQTYYFRHDVLAMHDRFHIRLAQRKIPFLLRFINRKTYHNMSADPALFDIIRHPAYESDYTDDVEGVEMSAVNVRTETGLAYYCACLDFLFQRYASPDSPYGWSTIVDIGNEINAQRIWNNCGAMSCEGYMAEYTVALRLAWLLSHKYNAHHRVNVSLEQSFCRPHYDQPLHHYPARECLENLLIHCHRDGDFDWGVSAHPYPEFCAYPDFYNDRTPTFSLDTPIITMKNMEVWPFLLSQPEYLYRGQPRQVLFDEQGFNTREEHPYTEEQGAYAFVLAWLKMRKNPQIDLFLINRHIDIPFNQEYGLNLGLRRCLGYADEEHLINIPGPHKMICHAIAAMDTPQEDAWIRAARAYIGPDLFDSVLNPPAISTGSGPKTDANFNF